MTYLKTFLTKSPVLRPSLSRNIRHGSTAVAVSHLEAINMSFASYESTQSYEGTPPLIVMHGLMGSKANWNSMCKALHQKTSPKRKIIAVDARNHGDSPHTETHSYPHLAEDTRLFLSKHRIQKAAYLGHSMGGRAMMYLALKYPELVERLIIGDVSPVTTSPNLRKMPGLINVMQSVNLPSNVAMSSARLAADIQLAKTISDKGLRSFLLTNLIQKSDGGYTWRINISALLSNFGPYISRFPDVVGLKYTGPVLFIAGGTSDFIQKTDHPEILKLFPNAEFTSIEGAGHWVHSEKPTEFLQLCTEFLNRKVLQSS